MAAEREKRFMVKKDEIIKYDTSYVDIKLFNRSLTEVEIKRYFYKVPSYIPDEQVVKYIKFKKSKLWK